VRNGRQGCESSWESGECKRKRARQPLRCGYELLTIVGNTDTEAVALPEAADDALPLGVMLAGPEALPEPLSDVLGDDVTDAAALLDALAGGALLVTLAALLLVLVDETPGCVADGDASMLPVRVPVVVDDGPGLLAAAAGL
jgi:hypothetical protein